MPAVYTKSVERNSCESGDKAKCLKCGHVGVVRCSGYAFWIEWESDHA
jgi:hypothetical protein